MKKIFYILIAILSCNFLTSCQEEEALLFSDSARVQFTSTDDYPYSFVWSDKSVTEAVVKLPIKVIGGPGDAPRKLRISQITEYDVTYEYDNKGYLVDSTVTPKTNPAESGVHYVPFNDAQAQELLVVEPGNVTDSVSIIVKRDASLASKKVRLRVQLEVSDDFLQGESKYLARTIILSDMLEKPDSWYNYSNAYYYLGTYSVAKHELMIKVLKELQSSDSRVDDEWISKGNSDATVFVYWRAKFVEALEEFNNDPANIASGAAPLREDPSDPTSAVVTFPTKVV